MTSTLKSTVCRSTTIATHPGKLRGKTVPPRLDPEVRALIVQLLNIHKNASEVQRQMRARSDEEGGPIKVGVKQITSVAEYEHIDLKAGRPGGYKMPVGSKRRPGGGRKKGPGKKFSPYRKRAQELRGDGNGLSLRAIAVQLGEEFSRTFTAEGVRKLLLSDDTEK